MGHHFLKPGDSDDTSVSKVLNFVPSAGLLNAYSRVRQNIKNGQGARVATVPAQMFSTLYWYSNETV
jgi:hypothetical protein